MIKVDGIVAWSTPATSDRVPLDGDLPHVSVRDLPRSLRFYSRVFGFQAERVSGSLDTAMLATATRVRLMLHQGDTPRGSRPPLQHWGFVVSDLDRARELAWDLGVKAARDSGDPDHIYRWSDRRALYVHDPDENEIELVELANVIVATCRA